MVMRKASPDTDQIARSLLQKALRRADFAMTQRAVSYLISIDDFDWMRKRLAVLTFEECWPYGLDVSFEKDQAIICKHIIQLSQAVKNRNAAGLGSLAYALSQGDESVFEGTNRDRDIRIIAEAIKRHRDFWDWTRKQSLTETQSLLVQKADQGFRKSGWPWDRAFAQAAAYLAITGDVPNTRFLTQTSDPEFPLWVAIDKHTQQGKAAIRAAAQSLNCNANKALWLAFYFESAQCNKIEHSPWWEREKKWRIQKLGLTVEEGQDAWASMKPIVIQLLREETNKLRDKIGNVELPPIAEISFLENPQSSLF